MNDNDNNWDARNRDGMFPAEDKLILGGLLLLVVIVTLWLWLK